MPTPDLPASIRPSPRLSHRVKPAMRRGEERRKRPTGWGGGMEGYGGEEWRRGGGEEEGGEESRGDYTRR